MNHIGALSGGKDSTAMALWLSENEPRDYTWVCTPTGDELPEMFEHWRKLGELLGKPILPVMALTKGECGIKALGLNGAIAQEKCLPNHQKRFCTRILKIDPYRKWLAENTPAVSYVGLRADEEGRAGGAYSDIPGVTMRFPLREIGWREADVWSYLEQRNVKVPERTDCARCYHQQLGEWWRLWREFPEIYAEAEAQEQALGHTFRNPQRDTWPAKLADLRREFEAGKIPPRTKLQRDLFRGTGQCRVCTL